MATSLCEMECRGAARSVTYESTRATLSRKQSTRAWPITRIDHLATELWRAYTSYAKTERHKSFENIDVSFDSPLPPSAEVP